MSGCAYDFTTVSMILRFDFEAVLMVVFCYFKKNFIRDCPSRKPVTNGTGMVDCVFQWHSIDYKYAVSSCYLLIISIINN